MPDYELGSGYVTLLPSVRGFSKKAESELKRIDLEKSVDLDADASKVKAAIAEVQRELKALDKEKANPGVEFDIAVAEARANELIDKIDELNKKTASPKVKTQIAEAQRDLNKINGELERLNERKASVNVDAMIAEGQAKLEKFNGLLDEIERKKTEPKVTADTSQAMARLSELDNRLATLSQQTATPEVELQIARAQQEALRIRAELERLGAMKPSPQVDADIAAASAKLGLVNQQLAQVDAARATPEVVADVSRAQLQLSALQSELSRLDLTSASPDVQVKAAQAQQEILRLTAELTRLGSLAPSVQVDADIASASAKIAALRAQVAELGGKRVNVNVDASGAGNAALMLGGVVAALGAIAAAAPAAAAALAAVGGAAGALGQGAAAGIAGFSGIGDALKALEADEKSAATSSAAASGTRSAGAKQVASAQSALAQAQTQADRAAITGAQQVGSAIASLNQSRTQQARTAITGAQQVAAAVRAAGQAEVAASRQAIQAGWQRAAAARAVADAQASANARVASAEASLANSQRARQYAQEALTRATQDAVRANRDLQLSVAGAGLSEERAALSLAQARDRLAKAGAGTDPLAMADMALSVREAEQNLKETQVRYGDLTQEQAKWARTGVQGSDQVVAATRSLEEAQRGVGAATAGVTEAQISGAKAVSAAQEAAAQQAIQASWQQSDAAAAVSDAYAGIGRASQQAAWANADAADQVSASQAAVGQAIQQAAWQQEDSARAVSAAQRQLAEAYTAGGEAAAGGAKQAEYALSKLTPAGRSMVNFLRNEFQPAWKRVTGAIAEEMLPGVERGMRSLLAVEPVLRQGLAETGSIIGDLAERGGKLAASPPFQASFASIMSSNNRALQSYGDAGLHMFGALTDLTAAAGPVTERFARLAENSAQAFESWVIGARQTGELTNWLQKAGDTLEYLGGWLADVGSDLAQFAVSLAPLGGAVLEVVRGITDWVSWLAQLNPGLTSVVAGAGLAAAAASKLGTAMSGMAIAQSVGGLRGFANVSSTLFNPSALAATTALTNMRTGFDRAGAASGGFVQKMTGSATAGYAAGRGMQMAGTAASGLASGLPLVGGAVLALTAIVDASTTSTNELADAMERGGKSAQEATAAVEAQRSTGGVIGPNWISDLDNWIKSEMGIATSVEEVRAELDKRRASMTDLQRAQSIATETQGNYEKAVRDFGVNSPQAIEAQRQLASSSATVAREQENARRATMNATQALTDQQNKILGSINARLGLEQSVRSTKQAQDEYAAAVRNSGAGSDEAKDAELRLQQAQTAQADAAMRAAAEEAKKKGVVDTSAASNTAYAQSIGDMVSKTTGQLTPALQQMVQGLDYAGLSAAGAKVQIDNAGNAVAVFPNGKTVQLDANASPVYPALAAVKAAVDSTKGTIGVDADPGPATATVGGFKLNVDATTGTVGINGNISPADQARLGIKAKTDGTTGTMFVDGNPVPCDGKLNGMRVKVDKTTGVMTVDGNPQPANNKVAGVQDNARKPQSFDVGANVGPAEEAFRRLIGTMLDGLGSIPVIGPQISAARRLVGWAEGGLIPGYAAGGAISHKQVIRGYAQGARGSKRIAKSDTVPAMLTPGEFVVRKQSVEAVGLKTLTAINGMAKGGPVGFAAGGAAKPMPAGGGASPSAAPSAAPVPVPTGDPAATTAAAGATGALSAQMASATATAGMLAPALAAVTAGQQQMTTAGVTPLVGAMTGALFPALLQYGVQVGVQAPMANAQLQAAQVATQVSTAATAANTAINSASMAATTTGMSLAAQAQHAGLRAGQTATQLSTNLTAQNAAANNANVAATTTGMSLQSQAQHAGLRAGQAATQVSSNITAANSAATNAGMAAATTGMSQTSQLQHTGLRLSQGQTVMANNALALNTQVQTANMSGATTNMSGVVQNHLGQVRGAQGVTAGSTTAFADSWRAQLARTMPDSGNPLKWVINFPIRSITDAWNHLDGQFSLGKHVNPYIPNFAAGGLLRGPGTGTSDSILGLDSGGMATARVSNGEYVVREKVAKRTLPFLSALNSGDGEALQAAGGLQRVSPKKFHGRSGFDQNVPRRAAGGPVDQRINAAKRYLSTEARGAPYVYGGGTNPRAGMDCSSLQSAITHILSGRPPNSGRIGTTASMPWGGFAPGLKSAYAIGNKPNDHMAATLGGQNAEQHGPNGTPFSFPSRWGADNGYFTQQFHLPVVGGQFVSGGAGGGGFDPTPAVNEAFAKAYKEIGDVPKFFGPSDQVARGQGVARFSADKVKEKALTQLMAMFATSGGGVDISGISGAVVEQVKQVAARFGGWDKGPQWDNGIFPLVAKESSWDPGAANPTTSARGLFQKMTSLYGPVEPTPAGQANWGLGYIRQRYGDPVKAWAFHRARGFYDNGGIMEPGEGGFNGTKYPERVLNNVETRSYDTLTQLVGKNGVKVEMAPYEPLRSAPVFENLNVTTPQGATTADVARAINFGVKSVKRGGVHA
ncbi:hypothetical protein EV383_4379 [Pseudonocardia sediminis]|uniref:Uncharacterized protein n=1 Tax=Pseudonocardia sediminis TaxID=1397368 RepID=A0A4Q7V056_PSEST|nr:hypothetical protein [Pseudonocardia sediminis]RZT87455.1 hypothetical protein EV383_4379 [Pseudonocardia sediminis]